MILAAASESSTVDIIIMALLLFLGLGGIGFVAAIIRLYLAPMNVKLESINIKQDELDGKVDTLTIDMAKVETKFVAHTKEQEKTNKRHSTNIKELYDRTNELKERA